MKKFLKEFKTFAQRGNAMDMAIAVIVGGAFQNVVASLTGDIIDPILGLFLRTDLSNLKLAVCGTEIRYGAFLTVVINFLLMSLVVFIMVKLVNKVFRVLKIMEIADKKTKSCPYCQSGISIKAVRCPNCTSDLTEK